MSSHETPRSVIVVGAGVGGLACATFLAKRGFDVTIVEAAPFAGGLAASFDVDGLRFDGGPYILLDKPGLGWAFNALGADLERDLDLVPVSDVYEVRVEGAPPVRIKADLEATAAGIEASFPGSATKYRAFIDEMKRAHSRLAPMLTHDEPGAWAALTTGAFRALPALLRPLSAILERSGLPAPVREALAIWTHIAGQTPAEAPAPLAFVAALIHTEGCYVPRGGVGAVASFLHRITLEAGVRIRFGTKVERILTEDGRTVGVRLASGEELRSAIVVSNASGVGTLLDLVPGESGLDDYVRELPLQSPGVAAYLALERAPEPPYLRFWLTPEDPEAPSRLVILPSVVLPEQLGARIPARVVAPLAHGISERLAESGQEALLDRILAEPRLREELGPFEVLVRRTARGYGERHHLHRDSMNPVMTAAFMRRGRLPQRLSTPKGLYLVGSSTHPGQWVSFCTISGVLGARKVLRDRGIDPDAA
jgi:phytoene dehydrogenase-like protein